MSAHENKRETGGRIQPAKGKADASDQVSQSAAKNRKPPGGMGNSEPSSDVDEKTHHSDGRNPPLRARAKY